MNNNHPTPRNPWISQHLEGEYAFTGGEYTRQHARELVLGEFADGPDPEPCGNCGETAYYRATVGCLQCPNCRSIEYGVWVHKETGEERRSMNSTDSPNYRLERRWSHVD